jgi:hypothetical protein
VKTNEKEGEQGMKKMNSSTLLGIESVPNFEKTFARYEGPGLASTPRATPHTTEADFDAIEVPKVAQLDGVPAKRGNALSGPNNKGPGRRTDTHIELLHGDPGDPHPGRRPTGDSKFRVTVVS